VTNDAFRMPSKVATLARAVAGGVGAVVLVVAPLAATAKPAIHYGGLATRLPVGPAGHAFAAAAAPAGTTHGLADVSYVSPHEAWAVGTFDPVDTGDATFVRHWDGTAWHHVESPNTDEVYNELAAVVAVSPNDVWAVGQYSNHGSGDCQSLIEHWDGTSWQQVPIDEPGIASRLNAVTASGPDDVYAYGQYFDGTLPRTLVEHWDGSTWSLVDTPLGEGESVGEFFDATQSGADDVWAVGYMDTSDDRLPIVEHFDGSAWTAVDTPDLPGESELFGVSARSANDVWAAGIVFATPSASHTLIEHWDGKTWSQVASPDGAGHSSRLVDVTVLARGDVLAVGASSGGQRSEPLTEHWEGHGWSVVDTGIGFLTGAQLTAINATSADNVEAVGGHSFGHKDHSLTEHWDGSTWTLGG
jgi:hypothetical protein